MPIPPLRRSYRGRGEQEECVSRPTAHEKPTNGQPRLQLPLAPQFPWLIHPGTPQGGPVKFRGCRVWDTVEAQDLGATGNGVLNYPHT